MSNAALIQSTSLIFTEGSSDKEYNCQIVQIAEGYAVTFQYGRRGNALTCGTKTAQPVQLAQAEKLYNQLVKEKIGKGYRAIDAANDGEGFTNSTTSQTFQAPQLLNEVTEDEAIQLLSDDRYVMLPKMDGKRILISMSLDQFAISNKLAKGCSVPDIITKQIKALKNPIDQQSLGDVHLDGELIGSHFFVFARELG